MLEFRNARSADNFSVGDVGFVAQTGRMVPAPFPRKENRVLLLK
jgi:hypothetical protein